MHDTKEEGFLPPETVRVLRDESNNLTVQIEGRDAWQKVVAKLAFPYSDPTHYVTLVSDTEEIGIVRDLDELDRESRELLSEALAKRYHIPEVLRVMDISEANNAAVWTVETDRGERQFMVRDRHNFRRFRGGDTIIVDVDGNRFRLARDRVFDEGSRRLMENHG